MPSNPLDRFMALEKKEFPSEWLEKYLGDKVLIEEFSKNPPASFMLLLPFDKTTFYEIADYLFERGYEDFKIYHIQNKSYWIAEVEK